MTRRPRRPPLSPNTTPCQSPLPPPERHAADDRAVPAAGYHFIQREHHPPRPRRDHPADRDELGKSIRLNSCHANISYAVFCLNNNISIISILPLRLFPLNHL